GVVAEQPQPRPGAGRRPLEQLEVAVGVAEGRDRATADGPVDAHGLAGVVVDELDLGEADQYWLAVPELVFHPDGATHDLLRRDAVDSLGPRPHELDAATGDDVCLEAEGAQVGSNSSIG